MKLSKIVTGPVGAIRRNVAETRAAQAALDASLREQAANANAARQALVGVWCTTTGTAPFDFDVIGMVFGRVARTPEDAIYELMLAAAAAGGDGVLGAAILPSVTGGSRGGVRTAFIGYGTAIRRPGPAD